MTFNVHLLRYVCIFLAALCLSGWAAVTSEDDTSMLQVNQTVIVQKSIKRVNHTAEFLPASITDTLGKRMDGMKDKVCDKAHDFLAPFVKTLNEKLKSLKDTASSIADSAVQKAKELTSGLTTSDKTPLTDDALLEKYQNLAKKLLQVVIDGWSTVSNIAETVEKSTVSALSAAGFSDASSNIGDILSKVQEGTSSVTEALNSAYTSVDGIASSGAEGVRKRLKQVNMTLRKVNAKTSVFGGQLKMGVLMFETALQDATSKLFGGLCNETVSEQMASSQQIVKETVDHLTKGVSDATGGLSDAATEIKERPAFAGTRVSAGLSSILVMLLVVAGSFVVVQ